MYVPKYFQVNDQQEINDFIHAHSFATLVSNDGEVPVATHLPLELEERAGKLYLTGHLAYANPHWRTFEKNATVLAMFQGPHAYVSASWYNHHNVPTWNYMAVHAYGRVRIVDDERLKRILAELLEKYETGRENAVLWETLSHDMLAPQLKAIVGFEIEVERIDAKYKLSQKRNDIDYRSIIAHLEESNDADARKVAEAMRKLRSV